MSTFYQRNRVYKKQVISGEQLKICTEFDLFHLKHIMLVYGIETIEDAAIFLIENEAQFIEAWELGRTIKKCNGFHYDINKYRFAVYI